MLNIEEQIKKRITNAEKEMQKAQAIYQQASGAKIELERLLKWLREQQNDD